MLMNLLHPPSTQHNVAVHTCYESMCFFALRCRTALHSTKRIQHVNGVD